MKNILVICGSPAKSSRTRGAAYQARKTLSKSVNVLYFDAGMDRLPLYTGESGERDHPAVKKLHELAGVADGFFICTPEYHNGMSGALKNALDFLSSAQMANKPAAIAAASGGGKGGINALNNLRLVLRGLYALVIPDQFIVNPSDLNEDKQIVSEEAVLGINRVAENLVNLVNLMK